ncbi:bifunctional precorrin-2 dehydrogenase/sirohydrochlorin ferrochelatase [Paenibacillus sp. NFR01]|uniref:precorrin-2 dehydrogenase/sirohydrochlorin ferrochelatase family protein n=1 Tax=Paenibacillus sp. NFR01 TaxID=1566279 RepID=UPI0008B707D7|nr:NAD(P)-dependent oxidoreductase [Paenibacillus sp. NFR01]SEU17823.1 precorrin-2 dehydrogenase / sirohydrochlorin ferrochelatase [Paenibacillus sp. NFR01]
MPDHYLPVMLDVRSRLVVVVGGGRIAERKIGGLLEAGAAVQVVSPALTAQLALWAEEGALDWIGRGYAPGDLHGAFLVYAASGDAAVNEAVAEEAHGLGLPVNVASRAAAGSFITPGVLRRGRLTVAVSTSGAGPAAAAQITALLAETLGEEYEPYLEQLYALREAVKRSEPAGERRERLLGRLKELDLLGEIRKGSFAPWSAERIAEWIEANRE